MDQNTVICKRGRLTAAYSAIEESSNSLRIARQRCIIRGL